MNIRTRREIAGDSIPADLIQPTPDGWRVPSDSGNRHYFVQLNDEDRRSAEEPAPYSRRPHCTCADHRYRHERCKHIAAVFKKLAAFEITMGEVGRIAEAAQEWYDSPQ